MLRFPELESLGLSLAAMTDIADGDFARPGGRPASDVFAIAGLPSRNVTTLRQVHGTHVECIASDSEASVEEGDALATGSSDVAIAVRVADCVPVFLFDPQTRSVSVVHAGRQGTYDGIARLAVEAMRTRFKTVPSHVRAVIGPSAGPCCYQVSEQLAAEFRERGYPTMGRHLDLWNANARQLDEVGVPPSHIKISGICTICSGRFHSYRATGTTARNLAVLAL